MDTHPDYSNPVLEIIKICCEKAKPLFIHLLGQNFIDLYLPHIPGKKTWPGSQCNENHGDWNIILIQEDTSIHKRRHMGGVGCQWGVVLAQWGAQERQNWPGAQECETPSYPSSCFKTESEKFNSVLDSILMFVLILWGERWKSNRVVGKSWNELFWWLT